MTAGDKKRILATSFDYDNSLAHYNYRMEGAKEHNYQDVIDDNQALITYINEMRKGYDEVVGFVGSNRQNDLVDRQNYNRYHNRSCFIAIQEFCKHMEITLDPILLGDFTLLTELTPEEVKKITGIDLDADLNGMSEEESTRRIWQRVQTLNGEMPKIQKDGTSFAKGIQEAATPGEKDLAPINEDKILLIYTQLQRMAERHPDNPIDFHFFDDDKNILSRIASFFTQNPRLIPKNVTLSLEHYAKGEEPTVQATIKGVGERDPNYRHTIRDIATWHLIRASNQGIMVYDDVFTPDVVETLRGIRQETSPREAVIEATEEPSTATLTEAVATPASESPKSEPAPISDGTEPAPSSHQAETFETLFAEMEKSSGADSGNKKQRRSTESSENPFLQGMARPELLAALQIPATPENMTKFAELHRKLTAGTIKEKEYQREINKLKLAHTITHIETQLQVIEQKATELEKRGHFQSHNNPARHLHNAIKYATNQYTEGRITLENFKKDCQKEIETYRPQLETHRGWKQILGNLLVAVLTLVVFYPAALAIHKRATGNTLFFSGKGSTDSSKKAEQLAEAIEATKPPTGEQAQSVEPPTSPEAHDERPDDKPSGLGKTSH